jgi:hypothetical protein
MPHHDTFCVVQCCFPPRRYSNVIIYIYIYIHIYIYMMGWVNAIQTFDLIDVKICKGNLARHSIVEGNPPVVMKIDYMPIHGTFILFFLSIGS